MPKIEEHWYRHNLSIMMRMLLPFSLLFSFIIKLRRWLYRVQIFKCYRPAAPVIVIGNITAGGTGKTPMVIWLAQALRAKGMKPGIVSRGYGSKPRHFPVMVNALHRAHDVGDEVLLLQRRSDCPIVVCVNRVKAAQLLLEMTNCNIIISDDGLQHYALQRDLEIVMVDGVRRFGNGYLLPSGPLREPMSRLNEADFVIVNGGDEGDGHHFNISNLHIYSLCQFMGQPRERVGFSVFDKQPVHAVAGIAHAERFFSLLEKNGLTIIRHPFPDHYAYQKEDLQFKDAYYILMTEKDAVKCQNFANQRCYVVSIDMTPNQSFRDMFWMKLNIVMETRGMTNEKSSGVSRHSNELV